MVPALKKAELNKRKMWEDVRSWAGGQEMVGILVGTWAAQTTHTSKHWH
jgi:hypothetical protein